MVTTPAVVPPGLKRVSRVAVLEPLAGGIRRSTTASVPLEVLSCPTMTRLAVPESMHRRLNVSFALSLVGNALR